MAQSLRNALCSLLAAAVLPAPLPHFLLHPSGATERSRSSFFLSSSHLCGRAGQSLQGGMAPPGPSCCHPRGHGSPRGDSPTGDGRSSTGGAERSSGVRGVPLGRGAAELPPEGNRRDGTGRCGD